MLFASPPLPPGYHKAWSEGTCTAALYQRGTMIQPGSSQMTLLPGWLWQRDAEPHNTSSLVQGKGCFCSSHCMKTYETQKEGTRGMV